ncbi:hypothetical protein ACSYDW_01685 [Paeniglutamicibacter sp. R2-26]|uniref:hypothetical protein n=1 Tax=Paeniglutamicibacter sp. R2-26 TaxID=3144417 RepID=UPI003EE57350
MRKVIPALVVLGLTLSACAGPSADEFRQSDVQGNTACIHFGSGDADGGNVGRTNLAKAAEHGASSKTEAIRNAVDTDEAGRPVINDPAEFKRACEAQGMSFK